MPFKIKRFWLSSTKQRLAGGILMGLLSTPSIHPTHTLPPYSVTIPAPTMRCPCRKKSCKENLLSLVSINDVSGANGGLFLVNAHWRSGFLVYLLYIEPFFVFFPFQHKQLSLCPGKEAFERTDVSNDEQSFFLC